MEREAITDQTLEKVVGGSIVFSPDRTTCGLNNNKQFKVNDFDAVIQFINENKTTMTEREMLKTMMMSGLITRL